MISLLLSLFITSSWGLTLKEVRTTPASSDVREFIFKNGEVTLKKRSNYFDSRRDLRIGEFKSTDKAGKLEHKLKETLESLKAVDQRLAKHGTSHSLLTAGTAPHAPFFMLEGYQVKSPSLLYKEIKELVNSLEQQEWNLKNGVVLNNDYKSVQFVKNSKVSTQEFNFSFYCEKENLPTYCYFKNFGKLHLEK